MSVKLNGIPEPMGHLERAENGNITSEMLYSACVYSCEMLSQPLRYKARPLKWAARPAGLQPNWTWAASSSSPKARLLSGLGLSVRLEQFLSQLAVKHSGHAMAGIPQLCRRL